uniref:alpha-tubulin N-acetyltransferase 1 isoform X1 n=1 Tax=Doryrhamphus excisus TaxID=161450 RepID=UPI0025AE87A8|nr:alpha-tubulin N-acetyltransferase 1 isoform X1 [Doryrhamphus excisus]
MEFPFDINHLFSERVTILDQTLGAGRVSPKRPNLQSHIVTVIDELGIASAKAQRLTTPVTSANKLQSQQHQVYLMKDGESNGGRGVIVGFLKVGYKKLFLLDQQGVHIEAEPLCVLDFFVAHNLQRHGYGLELFNFMLQDKNLEPVLMAYDRPSPKLLSFLAKHYCLTQSVPQVNHFVVFDGFFLNKSVGQLRKVPLRKPDGEIKPYSLMEREAVRQEQRTPPWPFAPHSPQRSGFSQYSLSVGSSPSRVPPQSATVPAPGVHGDRNPHFPLERFRARSNRVSDVAVEDSQQVGSTERVPPPYVNGLWMLGLRQWLPQSQECHAARGRLYSRYTDTKSLPVLEKPLSGLRSGHAEAHKVSSIPGPQSRLVPHPPPSTTFIPTSLCSNAGLPQEEAPGQVLGLEKESEAAEGAAGHTSSSGWSWTGGNGCFSAQQVKQFHLNRSTCPW